MNSYNPLNDYLMIDCTLSDKNESHSLPAQWTLEPSKLLLLTKL